MNLAIIVATGRGGRFGSDHGAPKQYLNLSGTSVLRRSLDAFIQHPGIDDIIVVIHPDDVEPYQDATKDLKLLPYVFGGKERHDSVRNGLEAIRHLNPKKVLIHDAVRPFVSQEIITNVINQLDITAGAIPAIPVADTIKKSLVERLIKDTVDRSGLWMAQTPQGFIYEDILSGHLEYKNHIFTDDSLFIEAIGKEVAIVDGSWINFKITTVDDFKKAKLMCKFMNKENFETRVGIGYDIHTFSKDPSENGIIRLGGIDVEYPFKMNAHSDGDLVLHAITDAVLGSISYGDIGTHFSDKDPRWKGANSIQFLEYARDELYARSGKIINVDINIICEKPKIGPVRAKMIESIAEILQISPSRVSVKGKTNEKVDAVGRMEAIVCQVVISVKLPFEDEDAA